MDTIIGIDLGTTNSEVAALVGGRVRVLGQGESPMLPSCVGITPDGELLIGETARNQQLIHPERTVRSIKRKMGSGEAVTLGDESYSPQEISALILRELVGWATEALGERPDKAVITVPAYFSDAQRLATREAGQLAGLEVLRIINEPTAASLAFGHGEARETVLVYDLGGGTFDVSIVSFDGDVTEVLASAGDNRLGGDDFTQLLVEHVAGLFLKEHGLDLIKGNAAAASRLWWAAEQVKKELSSQQFVQLTEENIVVHEGKPLHLDLEISREDYSALIRPMLESTLESVTKALDDAKVRVADLDAVLLVGGATRTPLVRELLEEMCGLEPRQEVHPDLCVALGAAVLASRLAGHDVEQVLVDITPYSFGISYLGELDGLVTPNCYRPIIRRNTALPVTRTESYVTSVPGQTMARIQIFQGDDPNAMRNIPLGDFLVEGLTPMDEPNVVLCEMKLDLDGILRVSAIEKETGLSKQVTIENATAAQTSEQLAASMERLEELVGDRYDHLVTDAPPPSAMKPEKREDAPGDDSDSEDPRWVEAKRAAMALLERSRSLLSQMHDEDKAEAIELNEDIVAALEDQDTKSLDEAVDDLKELLYFVEGR